MTSEKPLLFTSVSSSRKKCYSGFACYSHLPDSTLIFRLFELDDFCFSLFQKCFLTWSFQLTDNLPLPTNVSWVLLYWLCHQSLFLSAQHLQERQCEWLALTLISPLSFSLTSLAFWHNTALYHVDRCFRVWFLGLQVMRHALRALALPTHPAMV